VPPMNPDAAQQRYGTSAPPTMNRLDYWLATTLEGEPGADRAAEAIRIIRCVRDLRSEAQHASEDKRRRAVRARARLGLPEFTYDWSSTWSTVTAALAGAFDVIRQEVQAVNSR
jgi:hypothetical protein